MFEELFAITLTQWEEKLCAALFLDSVSISSCCFDLTLKSKIEYVFSLLSSLKIEIAHELCALILLEQQC